MSVNSSSPQGSCPIPNSAPEKQPPNPEELASQRSQWLSSTLAENPQLLALRERVLPWTGGYSFANVVHTDTTSVSTHVNRYVILELVYQHLCAIGMHRTAEMLREESGHQFQDIDQPWDKTDLLLLVSLGVLPREDPWAIPIDPHHQFVDESLEEDFFASPYREDPKLIWQELLDPDLNIQYIKPNEKKSFSNIKCASLKRFVVFFATVDSSDFNDDELKQFCLMLHSITSSYHFFEHLLALFDCTKLKPDTEEQSAELAKRQDDLRLKIINFLKKWIPFHGLFIGNKTLKAIGQFLRRLNDDPETYKNYLTYADSLLKQLPKLSYGEKRGILSPPDDYPDIPDQQIIFQPSLKITDPSPLEVARQITLLFHTAFKTVHSREFVVALSEQKESHQTPTLVEFFDFGNRLTKIVLEAIVTAPNGDYTDAIKRVLEIADNLKNLGNYDECACVLRAIHNNLEGSPIWTRQDNDTKEKFRILWESCGEDESKIEQYNRVISQRFDGYTQTVPNLKVELRSVPKDSSPSFIDGLINWEKKRGICQKTFVLYRFQNKEYNFSPIPQIQNVINAGPQLTDSAIKEKIEQLIKN